MFPVQPVLGIDGGCGLVCVGQLQPPLPGHAQRSGRGFHLFGSKSVPVVAEHRMCKTLTYIHMRKYVNLLEEWLPAV